MVHARFLLFSSFIKRRRVSGRVSLTAGLGWSRFTAGPGLLWLSPGLSGLDSSVAGKLIEDRAAK